MALTKQRRNEIAWNLSLRKLGEVKANQLSTGKVHDRFQTGLTAGLPEHQELCDGTLWSFSNDLINTLCFSIKETLEAESDFDEFAEFLLPEARRYEIAYIYFVYTMYDQGLHVGKNTKREINTRIKGLGVSDDEAREFFKELIQDLTTLIFK